VLSRRFSCIVLLRFFASAYCSDDLAILSLLSHKRILV
jgi:hypothetical protein